jgi:hypothetical protein
MWTVAFAWQILLICTQRGGMPHSMIGRDDKDPQERRLRVSARKLLTEGKAKDSKALNRRAFNHCRSSFNAAQHKKTTQHGNATSWNAEVADLVQQYHRLLTEDETIENFDTSIRLVEDLVGARIEWQHEKLALQCLRLERQQNFDPFFARLGDAVQQFQTDDVAEAIEGRRGTEAHIEQQTRVMKAAFAMSIFPGLVEQHARLFTNGRGSFVLDACMLLFHQAYFALMPMLNVPCWTAERLLLLGAFRRLAHHSSHCSEALGVLALYYDALDKEDIAVLYYQDAISVTNSDSHEFMSVLQAAWTFCIERHRYREALEVLLSVNTRVVRSDIIELREMSLLTFDLMRSYYDPRRRSAG